MSGNPKYIVLDFFQFDAVNVVKLIPSLMKAIQAMTPKKKVLYNRV